MIKLSKLKMQGYKTFARETEMAFPSSITAIVGPNGSGKSNVADAIRWVLGEQSFSLLRAKRTEDMIYSGSDSRARAGMAEVSIHFDNQDGWLPIDYAEVVLTRRAYRDGQNDYLINNQRVRLKDFGELLAKTGLSDRTYTIIGQGLVDLALSIRPDERRKLFEEAAGIGLYRSRKEEALRRLETTNRNLDRAMDISDEIRPRLRNLEKQAQRVSEYKLVKESLRANLLEWYGYHWAKVKQEVDALHLELQKANETRDLGQKQIADEKQVLVEVKTQIDITRDEIRQLQDKMRAFLDSQQQHNQNIAILENRKQSALALITQLDLDLGALEETVKGGERSYANAQAEAERLKQELDTIEHDYQNAKNTLSNARRDRQKLIAERNQLQGQLLDTEKKGIQLNSHHSELKERLITNHAELKQSEKMINDLEEKQKELQSQQKLLDKEVENKRATLDKMEKRQEQLAQQLIALREELKANAQRMHQYELDLNKVNNQLSLLNQAQESLAGFSEGAKTLLQKSRSKAIQSEFVDLVSKLNVEEQYEKAIAAALGDAIDVLVLKDGELNASNIHQVLESVQDRVALISQNARASKTVQKVSTEKGVIGWASDLVQNGSEYRDVIDALLGQFLIVQDLETAQKVHKELDNVHLVTLNGEVFMKNGLVMLGKNRGSGKVSYQRLSRDYEKEIKAVEQTLQASRRIEEDLLKKIQDKEIELTQAEAQQNEARKELQVVQASVNELVLKVSKFDEQKVWFANRREDTARAIERTKNAIDDLSKQSSSNADLIETLNNQISELRLKEGETNLQELEQKYVYLETENQIRSQALAHNRKTSETVSARLKEDQQRLTTMKARKTDQEALIVDINAQLQHSRDELVLLKTQSDELQKSVLEAKELALTELEAQYENLSDQDLEKQKIVSIKERHITHLQLELVRQEEKLSTLRTRLEDDFGLIEMDVRSDVRDSTPLPFPDLVIESLPETITLSEGLEELIRQQKAQMRRIGSVNIEAEAEYQEVKARYTDLTAQIEDLNLAIKDIHAMVRELDEVMKDAFLKTYKAVNEQFSSMFTRLFNGGSARLVLVDEDSPIEGGIEIEAKLPGKREQGLVLLSGGERSLTAVALIFALLKVSPTPLCVMDEVDAMLDESNVGRFIDLLRELSQETQFILITHNRNTVAAADVIYGVTMGKDSASQLISLRLDEVDSSYMTA